MLARTPRPHTETIELRFRGPAARRDAAVNTLKDLGFVEASDSVPWREVFPEYAEAQYPGVALRALRRREGLTQKALSELTGIPQGHISSLERGRVAIGKERAKKLAQALNVGYKVFL